MLYQLRYRNRSRQANREMNMIRDTACTKTFALIVTNNGRAIGMKACARFLVLQVGRAILRAEDDVDEEVGKRLRHSVNFESGLQPSTVYPTLSLGLRPRLG